MKKLLILMLALTMGVGAVLAQDAKATKKAQPKKSEVVKFVTDIDCEGCAKKVLDVIPFKKGVKDVVVDVPTKAITVTYDPRKTNEQTLVEALNKIDVHVQKGCNGAECKTECKGGECGDHNHNHGHDHKGHSHAGHKH